MKLKFYFLCLIMLLSTGSYAQNKPNSIFFSDSITQYGEIWLPNINLKVLQSKKLIYKKPKGFKENPSGEDFHNNPYLNGVFNYQSNKLISDDDQVVAFITINPLFDKDELKYSFHDKHFNMNDSMYTYEIIGKMKSLINATAAKNWRKHVEFYPERKARKKFNTDMALRFSIKLKPVLYYKEKYKYMEALFIQKTDRGDVHFYCFCTEEGKKNLAKYWKEIEGAFRFED